MKKDTLSSLAVGIGLATIPLLIVFSPRQVQADVQDTADFPEGTQFAYVGGGCFWCVEAVFEKMEGVLDVVSGYAGGEMDNPTYDAVCSGKTGHAEIVRIAFNPEIVSLEELLDLFFRAHNPTSLNRQGADIGSQYRSIILYDRPEDKARAEKVKQRSQAYFDRPIVTEIVPLEKFYPAEGYHQDYFAKNPKAPYCAVVIKPKLDKLSDYLNTKSGS